MVSEDFGDGPGPSGVDDLDGVVAYGLRLGSPDHACGKRIALGEGERTGQAGVEREMDLLDLRCASEVEVELLGEGRVRGGDPPVRGGLRPPRDAVQDVRGRAFGGFGGCPDGCALDEILRIRIGQFDQVGVVPEQGLLKLTDAVLNQRSGCAFPGRAERGRPPRGLTHHRAGGHDAGGCERDVGRADVPTGHQHVLHVPRVQRAQWNAEQIV